MTAQPMDPKDVPATLVAQAEEAALRYDRDAIAFEWDGYNRAALAAVIPAIRAQTLAPLREFADDMRTWCSPYGVAVTYADRLTEEIDRAARGDQ